MTAPQAHNHHPLAYQPSSLLLSQPSPFTAGTPAPQGQNWGWFLSPQGIMVVCGPVAELSLLSPAHLAHRCSLLLLYPWCCQQVLPVFLAMLLAFCCLWGFSPFISWCCVLGHTPQKPVGNCILTPWGREGIEELYKSWYRLHSDRALLGHLLMHLLLMIALLGVITFTGHCAVIPNSW